MEEDGTSFAIKADDIFQEKHTKMIIYKDNADSETFISGYEANFPNERNILTRWSYCVQPVYIVNIIYWAEQHSCEYQVANTNTVQSTMYILSS